MTRTQNLAAMFALNAAAAHTADPEARLNMHAAYYLHQIVEALLTENLDSLPTAAHHG